jgi:hypothetical protein
LRLEFEDNVVVMDSSHPTSAQAQERIRAAAAAAKEAKEASAPNAPIANLKSKNDQMTYLLEATLGLSEVWPTLPRTRQA